MCLHRFGHRVCIHKIHCKVDIYKNCLWDGKVLGFMVWADIHTFAFECYMIWKYKPFLLLVEDLNVERCSLICQCLQGGDLKVLSCTQFPKHLLLIVLKFLRFLCVQFVRFLHRTKTNVTVHAHVRGLLLKSLWNTLERQHCLRCARYLNWEMQRARDIMGGPTPF